MKRIQLICALGLFLLIGMTGNARMVDFYEGTFSEMQAKAHAENRPYFVNFYTSWCSPCTRMNETTYGEMDLVEYVERNYLAYTVDAESFSDGGLELADEYQVLFYPTILLFSPEGKLLHKSTGFKNAPGLLALLKEYRFTGGKSPAGTVPIASNKPKSSPAKPKVTPVSPSQGPSGQGLFQISVSPQASSGYGVQIGVFGDYANVLKTAQALQAAFHENVLIHVTELSGKTVFRIILGPFSTRSQAGAYKKRLKEKEGRDGMVVELNRFK